MRFFRFLNFVFLACLLLSGLLVATYGEKLRIQNQETRRGPGECIMPGGFVGASLPRSEFNSLAWAVWQ